MRATACEAKGQRGSWCCVSHPVGPSDPRGVAKTANRLPTGSGSTEALSAHLAWANCHAPVSPETRPLFQTERQLASSQCVSQQANYCGRDAPCFSCLEKTLGEGGGDGGLLSPQPLSLLV